MFWVSFSSFEGIIPHPAAILQEKDLQELLPIEQIASYFLEGCMHKGKTSHLGRAQSEVDPKKGCCKPEPRKPSSCSRDTTASPCRRPWHIWSRAGASLQVENKQISSPCAETEERT